MPPLLIAFLISMLPIIELRGGLIYASAAGIPYWEAMIACCAGNILPVPFILLFIRAIFRFMERWKYTAKIVIKLEKKAEAAEKKIHKYALPGLFIFVAIPLPGSGAWTGALIAAVFNMRIKRAFPTIALGTVGAGVIMSVLAFLIPGLIL